MAKPAFKPKKVLWMDLEMTGLDPVEDRILEVAESFQHVLIESLTYARVAPSVV